MLHRKYKIVQKHLYDRLNDLLKLDVAIPDMAQVLTEVREYIQIEVFMSKHLAMHAYNTTITT